MVRILNDTDIDMNDGVHASSQNAAEDKTSNT